MNTTKLAHDLIVSANTAIYCYSRSPRNFAAALAALEESANAMNEAEAVQVEPVLRLDEIMKLADAYADATFEQGLNQVVDTQIPEQRRESLCAAIAKATGGAE